MNHLVTRDDKWVITCAAAELVMAGLMWLLGEPRIAIGIVVLSLSLVILAVGQVALRTAARRTCLLGSRPDMSFRFVMSVVLAAGVMALVAYDDFHLDLVAALVVTTCGLALAALFVIGAWISWRSW